MIEYAKFNRVREGTERGDQVERMIMSGLTASQLSFLAFHVKRVVYRWQWLFGDSTLRAWSGRRTVAIGRTELMLLIEAGLLSQGPGFSVAASAEGRQLVTALEGK